MKTLSFLVGVFYCSLSFSDVWVVPRQERVEFKKSKEQKLSKQDSISTTQSSTSRDKDDEIDDFLKRNSQLPAIWDYSVVYDFKTGSVLKGLLLNSILSTNLTSPVLVEIEKGQGFPEKTKLVCKGSTKHTRIFVYCHNLVTNDDEYEVDTSILNTDGSSGIKPDVIYEGSEKMVTGALVSGITEGVVNASSVVAGSSLQTGAAVGALSGVNEVSQLSRAEMKTIEPKVAAYSGKKVLIFFNKRFKK